MHVNVHVHVLASKTVAAVRQPGLFRKSQGLSEEAWRTAAARGGAAASDSTSAAGWRSGAGGASLNRQLTSREYRVRSLEPVEASVRSVRALVAAMAVRHRNSGQLPILLKVFVTYFTTTMRLLSFRVYNNCANVYCTRYHYRQRAQDIRSGDNVAGRKPHVLQHPIPLQPQPIHQKHISLKPSCCKKVTCLVHVLRVHSQ